MDKYTELLKDFAKLIADTDRENFLLKHELDVTKQKLAAAEVEAKSLEDDIAKLICKFSEEDAAC